MTRKSKGKNKRQKSGLNRSLLNVGIGNLKDFRERKLSSERVHNCDNCGYQCDRDVAAAMLMLNHARGMERASTDADDSTETKCASFKQVTQMKGHKRVSQR